MKPVRVAILASAIALTSCSQGSSDPFPARCLVDVSNISFGSILPPQNAVDSKTVARRVILRNLASAGTNTGSESLTGTVSILLHDSGAAVPPDIHFLPRNDDPDFEILPSTLWSYTFGATVTGEVTPGKYTGTISWGENACDQVTFAVTVVNRLEPIPTYTLQWGSEGTGVDRFVDPRSLVVDHDGNVWVVDTGQDVLRKYSPSGTHLLSISAWNEMDADPNTTMNGPLALAVGPQGHIFVSDTEPEQSRRRITMFTPEGQFVLRFGPGRASSAFDTPVAIDVDDDGFVYVLDKAQFKVKKYRVTLTNPFYELVKEWGSRGSTNGRFNAPFGLAVSRDGFVYVTDTINKNVQKFDSEGTFLLKWGSDGSGVGQFEEAGGIDVDRAGKVYVTDLKLDRIQVFDSDGLFVNEFGRIGDRDGEFHRPVDLDVDPQGNIYVIDAENFRMQRFQGVAPGNSPRPF